jgi:hypothetical protein
MSYQGYDKWEVYCDKFNSYAKTMKELKQDIENHIKTFYINKAETTIREIEYEVTKVSVIIKRKKN